MGFDAGTGWIFQNWSIKVVSGKGGICMYIVPEPIEVKAIEKYKLEISGKVEVETIKKILVQYGEDVTEDDISYMLNDADVDGDGWIDYKNFVRLLLNK